MKLLAIDCSTASLSVCAYDRSVVATARAAAGAGASELILEFVQRVLGEADWTLRALDGIAYGSGPGAFTGLRVACGAVQGLALGVSVPVVGVPSLAAIAQAAWRAHGAMRVAACLDARMREVYFGAYARSDGGWRTAIALSVAKPGALTPPAPRAPDWFGAGDGYIADPALARRLELAAVDASIVPDAVDVAELAAPIFAAGGGRPAGDAQPLYVRHRVALTEAERVAGARL